MDIDSYSAHFYTILYSIHKVPNQANKAKGIHNVPRHDICLIWIRATSGYSENRKGQCGDTIERIKTETRKVPKAIPEKDH